MKWSRTKFAISMAMVLGLVAFCLPAAQSDAQGSVDVGSTLGSIQDLLADGNEFGLELSMDQSQAYDAFVPVASVLPDELAETNSILEYMKANPDKGFQDFIVDCLSFDGTVTFSGNLFLLGTSSVSGDRTVLDLKASSEIEFDTKEIRNVSAEFEAFEEMRGTVDATLAVRVVFQDSVPVSVTANMGYTIDLKDSRNYNETSMGYEEVELKETSYHETFGFDLSAWADGLTVDQLDTILNGGSETTVSGGMVVRSHRTAESEGTTRSYESGEETHGTFTVGGLISDAEDSGLDVGSMIADIGNGSYFGPIQIFFASMGVYISPDLYYDLTNAFADFVGDLRDSGLLDTYYIVDGSTYNGGLASTVKTGVEGIEVKNVSPYLEIEGDYGIYYEREDGGNYTIGYYDGPGSAPDTINGVPVDDGSTPPANAIEYEGLLYIINGDYAYVFGVAESTPAVYTGSIVHEGVTYTVNQRISDVVLDTLTIRSSGYVSISDSRIGTLVVEGNDSVYLYNVAVTQIRYVGIEYVYLGNLNNVWGLENISFENVRYTSGNLDSTMYVGPGTIYKEYGILYELQIVDHILKAEAVKVDENESVIRIDSVLEIDGAEYQVSIPYNFSTGGASHLVMGSIPSNFRIGPSWIEELIFDNSDAISLEAYSFQGIDTLETVIFQGPVEKISSWAFYDCTEIEAVTFGSTVGMIERRAFGSGLGSVESLTFGDKVGTIKSDAFNGFTRLEMVRFTGFVETLENNAFIDCQKLTAVSFAGGVGSIGKFMDCPLLTYIEVNGNLGKINDYSFDGNRTYTLVDGTLVKASMRIYVDGTVGTIGAYAFRNSSLGSFEVNAGTSEGYAIESIGDEAFSHTDLDRRQMEHLVEISCNTHPSSFYNGYDGTGYDGVSSGFIHDSDIIEVASEDGSFLYSYKFEYDLFKYNGQVCANITGLLIEHNSDSAMDVCIPDSLTSTLRDKQGSIISEASYPIASIAYSGSISYVRDYDLNITIGKNVVFIGSGMSYMFAGHVNLTFAEGSAYYVYAVSDSDLAMVLHGDDDNREIVCVFNTSVVINELTIPDGVSELRLDVFRGCNIKTLNTNEVYSIIGDSGVLDGVEVLILGPNVRNIETTTIPETLTSFTVDPRNEQYVSVDGVLYAFKETYDASSDSYVTELVLFAYPPSMNKGGEFTVPKEVMVNETKYAVSGIANLSFKNSTLNKVTLQDNIDVLDGQPFFSTDITEIVLPDSIQYINSLSFDYSNPTMNVHSVDYKTVWTTDGAVYFMRPESEDRVKTLVTYFGGSSTLVVESGTVLVEIGQMMLREQADDGNGYVALKTIIVRKQRRGSGYT